jgi:DNA-binding NarL/FixJ family response regulator
MTLKTKIAIFDDNRTVRNSIQTLLQQELAFEVVGMYGDAKNCVEQVLRCDADVVLIDIAMPGADGIEAVRTLKRELPHVQTLVQTLFEDDERIYESIRAGASGYILKTYLQETLIAAIKELGIGGAPLAPSVARKLLNLIGRFDGTHTRPAGNHDYNLTPKEREVLSRIVNGLSHKMIAGDLHISYDTVRSHVKKIYEKLHVRSLTEVVAKAIHQQLV